MAGFAFRTSSIFFQKLQTESGSPISLFTFQVL
jgi:hypothetical protein